MRWLCNVLEGKGFRECLLFHALAFPLDGGGKCVIEVKRVYYTYVGGRLSFSSMKQSADWTRRAEVAP